MFSAVIGWLTRRRERSPVFAIIGAALFTAVVIFAHLHHEMWRDEIHCWSVGRNASGFWDLATGERRYDGHPYLWYYVLHLVSRLTRAPEAMRVLVVAMAGTSAFLWLRFAPLPRFARLLFLGSYYIVFEYSVISRSYTLAVLLTSVFCALYDPVRKRYFWLSLVLALLAGTSAFGLMVACALSIFLFAPALRLERRPLQPLEVAIPGTWPLLGGVLLFSLVLGFTVATSLPPEDAHYGKPWNLTFTLHDLEDIARRYVIAMLPIPRDTFEFWNTNALFENVTEARNQQLAGLGLFLAVLWAFLLRKSRWVLAAFLVGTGFIGFFSHAQYAGANRHVGHFVLLLFACVWLFARELRSRPFPWPLALCFSGLLAAQCFAGGRALLHDYRAPFSAASEAARFLRDHQLEKLPIVGVHDHPASAVAGLLDQRIYYPETGEYEQSVVFHNRRNTPTPRSVLDAARLLSKLQGNQPTIVVSDMDLGSTALAGFRVELLLVTQPTVVADEHFRLYKVTPL